MNPIAYEHVAGRGGPVARPAPAGRARPATARTGRRGGTAPHPEAARTERLAALGFVGAGIAHDVRNLLAVIATNLDGLEASSAVGEAVRERIGRIRELALTGAGLTRRLLAVADPAARPRAAVDVGVAVTATVRLLRASLPASTRIESTVPAAAAMVQAGEGEIESAIINLVRNAVDAMPDGGLIRVRVDNEDDGAVAISVIDEGTGMSDAVRRRAATPFFTAKGRGGTGLGLAGIARFATGEGGWLDFNAAAGRGTCVRLAFPAAAPI
ncbi:MAG: ATP-binding protein [Alphaproteobacteria bacterium]|nr:ATP-binding protein [Alphaproteobacteria bacterium]